MLRSEAVLSSKIGVLIDVSDMPGKQIVKSDCD